MAVTTTLPVRVWVGYDSREAVCSDVAAHSIRRRTRSKPIIRFLKHRQLRKSGLFNRQWIIDNKTGGFIDAIDNKPFSTEFSHTRFLVPALMEYDGWALFMDSDMIFLSDIAKLWALRDEKYAVMCVKHTHVPTEKVKMDDREQSNYHRKNWSSFMLINCGHEANKCLTPHDVNTASGSDLHSFAWLEDKHIGALPYTYNYIATVSPPLPVKEYPDVIHFTEGGPWFPNCQDVTYGEKWTEEYEHYMANSDYGNKVTNVPSISFEGRV